MTPFLLAQRSFWLETPASTSAQNHDLVFYTLLYVMAFFFFLVVGIMLAFVVIYRRRKGQMPEAAPTHNTALEIFWTVVPLGIVLGFFVLGLRYYVDLETPPAGADVVDVEASQWHFNFKYPNGAESDDLYLRKDRPVVLRLVSKDVTHALFIPAFRVQRNAVPGRNTQIWFKPTELTGTDADESFHVFCTQYCGNGHAEMHANAYVLNKEDYERKLADAANIFVDKDTKKPLPLAVVGQKLYASSCAQCHTTDGKDGTGPTWKGLYKSNVALAKSDVPGYTLSENDDDAKWDDYLVESILHPEVKIVQGFQNNMPSQESVFSDAGGTQRKLSTIVAAIERNEPTTNKEKKLVAIIEYIKSLGNSKYYKPIKTPESYGAETAKPQAAVSAETEVAKPAKSPNVEKPHARDRFAGRPADEPIDKSETPSPKPEKEEDK